MNKTKKILVTLLILFTASLIGIFVLFYSFNQGMKADSKEEEIIRSNAEEYLKATFTDEMGNQENLDYTAKVRDTQSGTDFLVYVNDDKGEIEDSFIAAIWRDDTELALKPYIDKKLRDDNQLVVLYESHIGKELAIDPNIPVSYKEYNVAPTIRLTIPRKKIDKDEDTYTKNYPLYSNR
ncbi:hypothetical protein MHI18_02315 [Peribacillus sp. FSL H8-0477]|uniref:hypothetical protein n=1 Tax=Peribacillus sp. FSL H8-0477 TaxID=2921388 RepID=UPI0030FB4714